MRSTFNIFRKTLLFFIALFSLWFLLGLAMYRMPSSDAARLFEGKMHYKFIDIDATNRGHFESFFDYSLVRIEGAPALYISGSDQKKLWAVDPREMEYYKYTLKVKILAPRLAFGEYGMSKVIGIERVNGETPNISK